MMKRFLTLILCAAMIATMLCIVPVSADTTVTTGSVAADYVPEGTAITTAEEFAAMTAGGKYYLANDITITATWNGSLPVVLTSDNKYSDELLVAFNGVLDGNGHTITTSVPLFANATGSTFKNLTVAGDVTTPTMDNGMVFNGSAVVIWAKGEVTFENVYNKANVLNGAAAGALIAYGATGTVLNIKNCVNNGNITGSSQVGGLAGYIQDDVVVIENCENNGVVTSTASYGGGIIGRFGRDAADKDSKATITNCVNNGAVNTNGAQTAGMLGYCLGQLVIENCVNNGNITNTQSAAGIFGIMGDKKAENYSISIKNCVNNGEIRGSVCVGGLVARLGRNTAVADGYYRVENCTNNGDVYTTSVALPTTKDNACYMGGLVAYAWGGANCGIINCINNGDVHGMTVENTTAYVHANYVGGLLGYVNGENFIIKNNINAGAITVEGTAAPMVLTLTAYNKNAATTTFVNNFSVVSGEIGAGHVGDPAVDPSTLAVVPETAAIAVTAEQLASGEVAFVANTAAGETVWYQTIGSDAAPTLDSTHKVVSKNPDDNTFCNPLVKIGEKDYGSFADAIAAAQAGDTLVLLADETVSETIVIDKAVTLDGNGKTITSTGVDALKVAGDSLTVTIKNLNVVSAKKGLVLAACTSADVKSAITITDTKITSNGGDGVEVLAFWTVNLDKVEIDGSSAGFRCNTENGANTVTVTNSKINGRGSYGFYMMQASTGTITDSTITTTAKKTSEGKAPNSAIQIKTSTAETGSTLTLNNVTASGAGYTVAVNPYNKIYINGGTYTMTTGEGYVNGDAVVNVGNADAYCKVTDGTFTSVKNCAIRVYTTSKSPNTEKGVTNPSVLDIEGGTFILNNPTSSGSALRAGTGDGYGTANIKGGHFITNGTGAVVNTANARGVININGGTFENNGENAIKVVDNTGNTAVTVVEFPEGVKKVEFKDGAFAPVVDTPDTPDVPGGDTTTVPGGDTTTAPDGDTTTEPTNNDTTTEAPTDPTEKPVETTKKPDEPKKKSCGGFAFAAQIVTILGAAITVVVFKKKN